MTCCRPRLDQPQRRTRGDAAVHRQHPGRLDGAGPAVLARAAPVAGGGRRGRPAGARLDGGRLRADPDGVRQGPRRLRRRRRLRGGGHLRRLLRRRLGLPTTGRSGGRSTRCPAGSRSGWRWRCCSADRTRCCCSTSRTTTSTSRPSAGWRTSCAAPRRPCCWSAMIGSCWPRRRPRSPPSNSAPPATRSGCTAAASPRFAEARQERFARFEELRRRWDEEHAKLKALVLMYKIKAAYNDGMASRYQAAKTRLAKFEEAGPAAGGAAGAEGVHAAAPAGGPASGPSSSRIWS